ncbi:MAG: alpha/beta hydrolase [Treponema sp.]|nr:alpha/beta hydrolase [Candidatus Treponema merdequi]
MIESVNINGMKMKYSKFGEGKKTLIIVLGISLKSVLASERAVQKPYKKFFTDYTIYLFDRRDDFPEDYNLFQMAEDTVTAIKSLNITQADFFGTSQGGMICQLIAIKYPELVKKLVLGSSTSRLDDSSKAVFNRWIELSKPETVRELIFQFVTDVYSEEFCNNYRDALVTMMSDATDEDIRRLKIMSKACFDISTFDELSKIKCPCFVIGSRKDKLFGPERQDELASGLNAKTFFYEDFSHGLYDETRDFTDHILSFLS